MSISPGKLNRLGRAHRLFYSLVAGSTAFAAAFGDITDTTSADKTNNYNVWMYAYASTLAVFAVLKNYCLPGRDIESSYDHSVSDDMASSEGIDSDNEAPKPPTEFYFKKYVYLLMSNVISFNSLWFTANASLKMIEQQFYENAEQAQASTFAIPGWAIAAYVSWYLLCDASFSNAIDSKTSHEEVFERNDIESGMSIDDRLTKAYEHPYAQSYLQKTKRCTRYVGSFSHTMQEILPMVVALNHYWRLRDIYNSDHQWVLWAAGAACGLSFAVVFAQTYLYEGREQEEAYNEKCGIKKREPSISYSAAKAFKWTLWMSVVVHGAAEILPWLLFPEARAPSVMRLSLAALSGSSECWGNARSEYREVMDDVNEVLDQHVDETVENSAEERLLRSPVDNK